MDNALYSDKVNELEVSLGLKGKTPVDIFYEKPVEWTLRQVPKRIQTPEMVKFAVEHDGIALKSVSKKLITDDLCKIAVMQNGKALEYVPEKYLTIELCELAIENNGLAIHYVPEKWITSSFAHKAVCNCHRICSDYENYPIHYIPENLITEDLIYESVMHSPCSLKDIPSNYITKELLLLAVSGDGTALKFVPQNRISKNLIGTAISSVPSSIQFVPEFKLTKEICDMAFHAEPFVFKWIPEKYITREMCITVIENSCEEDKNKQLSIELFPDTMRNDRTIIDALIKKIGAEQIIEWNNNLLQRIEMYGELEVTTTPLTEDTINYVKSAIPPKEELFIPPLKIIDVETPPPSPESTLVKAKDKKVHKYDLTRTDENPSKAIYYITDIHLEHQIQDFVDKNGLSLDKISSFVEKKVLNMLSNISGENAILLIGGDVGHTKGLVNLFYYHLLCNWRGKIIAVLGNHELWDNHPEGKESGYVSRPIDDIISDYREMLNMTYHDILGKFIVRRCLLQNAVYILYKNCQDCIIEEGQIHEAPEEDLRDICSKASLIVLGGIGFSGLKQHYNAELGLYRSAVTTLEEDKALSNRFRFVYDKLNRCAGDMQVIVLTHTPVSNWTDEPCNPNWIYVNGHTHQNSFIHNPNGITVLSDNQVGYKPTKWKLNCFYIDGWYDPFKSMTDGIYEISSEMYDDFYRARGIMMSNELNYPGKTYVLKRNGYYMFVQQSKSNLCLLAGGLRKRLDHDIQYYYDNMELYCNKVLEAFTPYQQALREISEEIKRFAGHYSGKIHGCIVDIDFWNHVYLNPFDGKVTPYYAENICSRLVYDDLPSLLKAELPELYAVFRQAYKSGEIPLLSQYAVSKQKEKEIEKMTLATVPELVLGTEMYDPSRIMRSIQYIFDNNIIRIWNDEILKADFNQSDSLVAIEEK